MELLSIIIGFGLRIVIPATFMFLLARSLHRWERLQGAF